jgi:hypothetical protein
MQSEEPFDFDPGYRLAARGRQEAEDERLALLERIFDPLSRQRRSLVQPGWRCLEVGAGRGSMAVRKLPKVRNQPTDLGRRRGQAAHQ